MTCRLLIVVILSLGLSPQRSLAQASGQRVDISAVKSALIVLTDGAGHYLVVEKANSSPHFYYGNGKTLSRVGRRKDGSVGSWGFARSFWDPRIRKGGPVSNGRGRLEWKAGSWRVFCDKGRETKLHEVAKDTARKVLNATYRTNSWNRRSHALARDDDGNYYYVDRRISGRGYRLFIGSRGTMKQVRLINDVHDSEGEIYITKRGKLYLTSTKQAAWKNAAGKKRPLTYVPVGKNQHLIYAELIYANHKLGSPCDDL